MGVRQLKEELGKRGLKKTGNKDALQKRLKDAPECTNAQASGVGAAAGIAAEDFEVPTEILDDIFPDMREYQLD